MDEHDDEIIDSYGSIGQAEETQNPIVQLVQ
jgi:hypothetical protein